MVLVRSAVQDEPVVTGGAPSHAQDIPASRSDNAGHADGPHLSGLDQPNDDILQFLYSRKVPASLSLITFYCISIGFSCGV